MLSRFPLCFLTFTQTLHLHSTRLQSRAHVTFLHWMVSPVKATFVLQLPSYTQTLTWLGSSRWSIMVLERLEQLCYYLNHIVQQVYHLLNCLKIFPHINCISLTRLYASWKKRHVLQFVCFFFSPISPHTFSVLSMLQMPNNYLWIDWPSANSYKSLQMLK